ncbi:MAG: RDD family protein [Actinomycetota bacterium]|nr:RDD family protein [Actinomycetota bacterium]
MVLLALMLLGALAAADVDVGGWGAAFVTVAWFLVLFGYDVLFEVAAGGRTPGKRWTGIRVVDRAGGPVRFVPSVIRNLLRLIDILPGFYLVGAIAVVVSARNQRLGDLAAGTLVIRERRNAPPARWVVPATEDTSGWDVAQVTGEELATVRRFLERRRELLAPARTRLAGQLAGRLRPKVAGPGADVDDERFLELVAAAKAERR